MASRSQCAAVTCCAALACPALSKEATTSGTRLGVKLTLREIVSLRAPAKSGVISISWGSSPKLSKYDPCSPESNTAVPDATNVPVRDAADELHNNSPAG